MEGLENHYKSELLSESRVPYTITSEMRANFTCRQRQDQRRASRSAARSKAVGRRGVAGKGC